MTRPPPYFAQLILALVPPRHLRDSVLGDAQETYLQCLQERGRFWASVCYIKETLSASAWFIAGRSRAERRNLRPPSLGWRAPLGLAHHLRHVSRRLRSRPWRSVSLFVTVCLAVASLTTISTLIIRSLVVELPYPEAARVVRITTERAGQTGSLSLAEVDDLRGLSDTFELLAAYLPDRAYTLPPQSLVPAPGLSHIEEQLTLDATRVSTTVASRELFRVLGVPLTLGTPWPDSFDRTRSFGVLLSERVWRARFSSDPTLVGRSILMSGAQYRVFGIVPQGQGFPADVDMYRSAGVYPDYTNRLQREFFALGRLRANVTLDEARRSVSALASKLEQHEPETNSGIALRVVPIRMVLAGPLRPIIARLGILGLAVGGLSVATLLLLVTAWPLPNPMARWLDSSALVVPAALVGAFLGTPLLLHTVASQLAPPFWLRPNLLPGAAAIVVGISFVGVPIVGALGARLRSAALAMTARGSLASDRQLVGPLRLMESLAAAVLGIAIALTICASLLTLNAWTLGTLDHGIRTSDVVSFRIDLTYTKYRNQPDRVRGLFSALLSHLDAQPEIDAVGTNLSLPFATVEDPFRVVVRDAAVSSESGAVPFVSVQQVGGDYFDVVGIPLVRGRSFGSHDCDEAESVAIVGRRLARALWGELDAVGRQIVIAPTPEGTRPLTVVGVVEDVRRAPLLNEADLDLYTPLAQHPEIETFVVARTKLASLASRPRLDGFCGSSIPSKSCSIQPRCRNESSTTDPATACPHVSPRSSQGCAFSSPARPSRRSSPEHSPGAGADYASVRLCPNRERGPRFERWCGEASYQRRSVC